MRISQAQWDAIVEHAREEAPNECCGYAGAREGVVEQVHRAENIFAAPYRFEMDFKSLLAANELDDAGYEVISYHSHPKSAAVPSQQDINVAQYPDWVYFIVSLENEPEVRAWKIVDGKSEEVELVVE